MSLTIMICVSDNGRKKIHVKKKVITFDTFTSAYVYRKRDRESNIVCLLL